MTMSGSLEPYGATTVNVSFAGCNQGGIIMNGSASMVMSFNAYDAEGFPDFLATTITASQTYKNLSMQFPATGDNVAE